MPGKTTIRMSKTILLAGLALALVAFAATADAQDREGRWEFTLGTVYQLSTSVDAEGGTTVDTDNDFGFTLSTGYNINDRLATSFGFQWASVGYDSTVFDEDGDEFGISGSYDAWTLNANLIFNLMDGPLTPYVGAGIGYTWIDTNIPTGLPDTVCWYDPWWGYICYTEYPTKTTDTFSYQAVVGLRWEFNYSTFLRLNYASQWLDFDNAKGTPRFDVIGLDIGWIF